MKKNTVIIVEDSLLVCEQIKKMLSKLENIKIVGQAEGALEAINLINELKPDIVTLDLRLKEGSGFDVLKEIKKNSDGPVVIVFTNFPSPQYQEKCIELGANYFFDKSKDFDKISEVLKRLIRDSEKY